MTYLPMRIQCSQRIFKAKTIKLLRLCITLSEIRVNTQSIVFARLTWHIILLQKIINHDGAVLPETSRLAALLNPSKMLGLK